ncbi:MAG: DUF763 domain-containing protein [Candidatus Aenigmatarchaeota archaeon]|nr:MAG: DUF763 domain-containing protein [Candidatus Aenigmarchaeota archaeon]
MKKTGTADLPLHPGKAPRWLFGRMVKLSGAITEAIVSEFSHEEFIRRLADPYWFQAFTCVIGFDWHSSGTTTVASGALKEAMKERNIGIGVAGGKGKVSRRAPAEIADISGAFSLTTKKTESLRYASRMSAKVDNTALQDGYQLYHHILVFSEKGDWAVVQQGMSDVQKYARRYHWMSENLENFVEEPHTGICTQRTEEKVLDMTAKASRECRRISVDIVKDNPVKIRKMLDGQSSILDFREPKTLRMPGHHHIIDMQRVNLETLQKAYEIQPKNYEELLSVPGMGPKSVRALALVADVIYGKEPSWKDPARFSFAHGGKDGVPYPVDRETYDRSIHVLDSAVRNAKIGSRDRMQAVRRLQNFV